MVVASITTAMIVVQGCHQRLRLLVIGIPTMSQSNLADRHARLPLAVATESICLLVLGSLQALVGSRGIAAKVETPAESTAVMEEDWMIGVAVAEEDRCVEGLETGPGMGRERGPGMDRAMVDHQDDLATTGETLEATIEGRVGNEGATPQRCRPATGKRDSDVRSVSPTADQ